MNGQFFPKLLLKYKISFISTSFQKEIWILTHIAKKLQAHQFLPYCLSEKASGSKKFFCYFPKTVSVIDQGQKKWKNYVTFIEIFHLKFKSKSDNFYTSELQKNWGVKYCRFWLKYYGGYAIKVHNFFIFWPKNSKFKSRITYQNSFKKIKNYIKI